MEWRSLLRRIASDLSEKRLTVLGLKNPIGKICNCGAKGHMVSVVPRQVRNDACGAWTH